MATQTHNRHFLTLDLEFVRATEHASLAALRWFGRGNKGYADQAAVTAINERFRSIDCKGLVRIGEGRKDNAPGIFTGDRLGLWRPHSLPAAIALDPIDGTTLTAKGLPGAISVLAAAVCNSIDDDPTDLFPAIPSYYMEKLAVGPAVAAHHRAIELDAPLTTTLEIVADAQSKRICDLVAVVLDRPRHTRILQSLRSIGCGVRLISDGDIAAAIAPSLPDSGIDLCIGIGGSPEAVISAAAIKCLGGQQLCRMWFQDDADRLRLLSENPCEPDELSKIWSVDEMARGNNLIFAATAISACPFLQGVRSIGQHLVTHSLLISSQNHTMRFIETYYPANGSDHLPEAADCLAVSC